MYIYTKYNFGHFYQYFCNSPKAELSKKNKLVING